MADSTKMGIAVDLNGFVSTIYDSMLCMSKANRIIFADKALDYALRSLADFEMAYDCPDRRAEYTDVFISEFKVARHIVLTMIDKNAISITHKGDTGMLRPEVVIQSMFDYIARIDKQLGAWRGYVIRDTNYSKNNGQ